MDFLQDVASEGNTRERINVVHDSAVVDNLLDVSISPYWERMVDGRWLMVKNFFDFVKIEIIAFEVSTMMDDLGAGISLEAAFPGGDEGGVCNDLARRVDRAYVSQDFVGDRIFGSVGHSLITAYFAGKCKVVGMTSLYSQVENRNNLAGARFFLYSFWRSRQGGSQLARNSVIFSL